MLRQSILALTCACALSWVVLAGCSPPPPRTRTTPPPTSSGGPTGSTTSGGMKVTTGETPVTPP